MAITVITCPTGCADLGNLPTIVTDKCTPIIKASELTTMYFALPAAEDFTDAEDVDEWLDRLSQNGVVPTGSSATVDDLIRTVYITGDMPAPTVNKVDISGGRTKEVNPQRVINLDIDDATDSLYQLARKTECGNFIIKAWFKSYGDVGFGGNTGILGTLLLHPILPRGRDSIEKYTGTFSWLGGVAPDRFAIPV